MPNVDYSRIKTIIVDCDGVLTDGKIYYNHKGDQFKGFNSRDVRAMRELTVNGFHVIIVTASSWKGIHHFARRCGVDVVQMRVKKVVVENLREPFAVVGDDVWDLELMQSADVCFAPSNCDRGLHGLKNLQMLSVRSGEGVMAELVRELCAEKFKSNGIVN